MWIFQFWFVEFHRCFSVCVNAFMHAVCRYICRLAFPHFLACFFVLTEITHCLLSCMANSGGMMKVSFFNGQHFCPDFLHFRALPVGFTEIRVFARGFINHRTWFKPQGTFQNILTWPYAFGELNPQKWFSSVLSYLQWYEKMLSVVVV